MLYNDARDLPTIKKLLLDMRSPKWKKPAELVVELTDENFEEFVNGEEFTVVEFYAPWCGHCKKLLPEYEAAAADLNTDGIKLAKIDANKYTEIGQQYGVTGTITNKKSDPVSAVTKAQLWLISGSCSAQLSFSRS